MPETVFNAVEDEMLREEVGKTHVLCDSSPNKHKYVNFKDAIWNISSSVGKTE